MNRRGAEVAEERWRGLPRAMVCVTGLGKMPPLKHGQPGFEPEEMRLTGSGAYYLGKALGKGMNMERARGPCAVIVWTGWKPCPPFRDGKTPVERLKTGRQ